jgi:hypothetical protein
MAGISCWHVPSTHVVGGCLALIKLNPSGTFEHVEKDLARYLLVEFDPSKSAE